MNIAQQTGRAPRVGQQSSAQRVRSVPRSHTASARANLNLSHLVSVNLFEGAHGVNICFEGSFCWDGRLVRQMRPEIVDFTHEHLLSYKVVEQRGSDGRGSLRIDSSNMTTWSQSP